MEVHKSRTSHLEEREPLLKMDPKARYVPKRYYTGADNLKTIREAEEDLSPTSGRLTEPKMWKLPQWHHSFGLSEAALAGFIIAMATATLATATISLPVYLLEMSHAGSDTYTAFLLAVIWAPLAFLLAAACLRLARGRSFLILPRTPCTRVCGTGFLLGLGTLLQAYAAPPWRTHSFLHAQLMTLVVPIATAASILGHKQGQSVLMLWLPSILLILMNSLLVSEIKP